MGVEDEEGAKEAPASIHKKEETERSNAVLLAQRKDTHSSDNSNDKESHGSISEAKNSDSESLSSSSSASTKQLTLPELASMFQTEVHVKNRMYHFRLYKQCWVGKEGVDCLVSLTKKSRSEVLEIAKVLQAEHCPFEHVSDAKNHPFLEDDDLFYRFRNQNWTDSNEGSTTSSLGEQGDHSVSAVSLRQSIQRETQNMNMFEKIKLFERGVQVQDRKYHFRMYTKCFVGKEAVDFMVQSGLASDRESAVELGNTFMRDHNLMEHVTREHGFEDKYLFYRFIKRRNRFLSVDDPRLNTVFISLYDFEEDEDNMTTTSSLDTDDISTPFYTTNNMNRSSTVSNAASNVLAGSPGSMDFTSQTSGSHAGSYYSETVADLQEIADAMEAGVTIKTRRWRMKYFQECFVARDVVTFLVSEGYARNRPAAVRLGRRLQRELNLFQQVSNEHDFQDAYYFFRFTPKEERFDRPVTVELSLSEIAKLFENGVRVRTHPYRLKSYPDTFVGSRAVDFMVQSRLASSRIAAVRICRALVEQFNLFERVTGDMEFCDDHFLFRFVPESRRRDPSKDGNRASVRESIVTLNYGEDDEEEDTGGQTLYTRMSGVTDDDDMKEKLSEIARAFRAGVKVKNNRYRARVYQNTFIGSDAVSYLVNSSFASSRKEAVELGRRLEPNMFRHVTGDHPFKDDLLFYRFFEEKKDQSTHGLRISSITARSDADSCNAESFLPLETIADMLQKGVKVKDHRYHMRTFKKCFVGSDAVDFLVGSNLADSRVDAVDIGRKLCKENFFEHVCQDHDFKDEYLFYRFLKDKGDQYFQTQSLFEEIDMGKLVSMAMDIEKGIEPRDNRMGLRVFPNTFFGRDVCTFILDRFKFLVKSRRAAVQLGLQINKAFNLFEHVTNDYHFKDCDHCLYYFTRESERHKGMFFARSAGKMALFEGMNSRSSGFWESICEAVGDIPRVSELEIIAEPEDSEWAAKLKEFERKCSQRQTFERMFSSFHDSDQEMNESLIEKVKRWSSKLRQLDPRYQILSFFNNVAREGIDEDQGGERFVNFLSKRPLLWYLPKRASVFSVWRPCSNDSIRLMMTGQAVGKGLDIKGKSAKRGRLSAFVPFLQLTQNNHKKHIRMLSKDGTVRVFYNKDARIARDLAAEKLEDIALEMLETVKEAKKVLADDKAKKDICKDAYESMLLDMTDPVIRYIEDYAPERFGIEIPERLFWEAYFVRQDISRPKGSEYDTGRPSSVAFQDMNFASIRKKASVGSPRVVVFQKANKDSPMNPFELLMAYEERGRVLPVVSDFDCFLVGTRRVTYPQPMPPDQLDMLKWMLRGIESIIDKSNEDVDWMSEWIKVSQKAAKAGFYPKIPRFGLGDPRSYFIMNKAVESLNMNGAVRHGAESFNYTFPQELDEEFLVIADDLPGPLPWTYVNVEGLQKILSEKIDQGFTFPLNPKWVLMDDPKWKELYDKMLQSQHQNIVNSMNTWFPPDSGIREEIERLHEKTRWM